MYKNVYLQKALERSKNRKPSYKDLYYYELFRDYKYFNAYSCSVSESYFNLILKFYSQTMEEHRDYFCIYEDVKDVGWFLFCLKMLKIYTISFRDMNLRETFISNLSKEVGEGYFPLGYIDGKMEVFNEADTEIYMSLFRGVPYKE